MQDEDLWISLLEETSRREIPLASLAGYDGICELASDFEQSRLAGMAEGIEACAKMLPAPVCEELEWNEIHAELAWNGSPPDAIRLRRDRAYVEGFRSGRTAASVEDLAARLSALSEAIEAMWAPFLTGAQRSDRSGLDGEYGRLLLVFEAIAVLCPAEVSGPGCLPSDIASDFRAALSATLRGRTSPSPSMGMT